jgi:hypothetical protein
MPSTTSNPRRLAFALIAVAVTFCVHGTWISDLGVTDTRGPAISA